MDTASPTDPTNQTVVAALDHVSVSFPYAGAAVVTFAGDHDLLTRSEVSDLLESLLDTSDLVLADLSDARFVDSSIVSAFLATHRSAGTRGKHFRIQLGTESLVRRAFEICGILDEIDWASSREEALVGARRPSAGMSAG